MAYKALYRTYRPTTFEEVVGQEHIVSTLKNAVKQNKIAHAYLFCGPRGTGKTTVAKLLAKAVNCTNTENAPCEQCENCLAIQKGNHPDIVEIDAASNNGVDEVRDLIEKVKYAPIQGRYKVYIIDEVHMMSSGAFNALLKTLEEPPAHIIFILATTEPHKVLPTIISRCQRYDFTKVSETEITKRLEIVLDVEKITCEKEVLELISQLADGGVRDALSILDQCIAYAQDNIQVSHVHDIYGITTVSEKVEILNNVFSADAKKLLSQVKQLSEKGIDIKRLTVDLIDCLKECIIFAYTNDETLINKLSRSDVDSILGLRTARQLIEMIDVLMETSEKYRNASSVISYFEVCLLKLMTIDETKQDAKKSEEVKVKDIPVSVNTVTEMVKQEEKPILKEEKVAEEVMDIPEAKVDEINLFEIPEKKPLVESKDMAVEVISIDFLLQLLVSANKESKATDSQCWNLINEKTTDLKWARLANLLKASQIAASGNDFVILSVNYQSLANQINDSEIKNDLFVFMNDILKMNKQVFAVTLDSFREAANLFVEKRKINELPEPIKLNQMKVVASEKIVAEEDSSLTKGQKLFGLEQIQIMEEE